MHNTAERVELVRKRMGERRRQRMRQGVSLLAALCLLLGSALAETVGTMTGRLHTSVSGMSGSILLYEGAGGYVLVGVGAFSAAAALTVLCFKRKKSGSESRKLPEKGKEND